MKIMINRIYQGKVSNIELLDEKATPAKELDLDILGEHHQLFQDAVNYYLLALAAMASELESPMGKMRERMKESWEEINRGGRHFDGLRKSLIRTGVLGTRHDANFENGLEHVLAGNSVPNEVLQLAVDLLLTKVGGDAAIQQGGRGYWPRLCNPKAKPTWDYSPENLASGAGKEKLAASVHSELDDIGRCNLANEVELSWTVKVQPGEYFEAEASRNRLREGLDFFLKSFANPDNRLAAYLEHFPNAKQELTVASEHLGSLPELTIPRNRKAAPALVFSTLIFKFFPTPATQALLALHVAKPKESKKIGEKDQFLSLGDDPIKLARGERGYIFPAFTALPIFESSGPDDIKWNEFDIAAFKEALKTVNQFRLKTEERRERRLQFLNAIRYMEGEKVAWVDPNGGEESEAPARMKGDPRFLLAKKLIFDLKKTLELTDLDNDSLAISKRRLRGWSQLVEKFNQIVEAGEAFSEKKRGKLKEELSKFQKNHVDDMGDVRLFEELISNGDYWCFWQKSTAEERSKQEANDWATQRFLDQFRAFAEYQSEAEWLNQPIRFTPADALESRRLFMFSDLAGRSAVKHRQDALAVEVSVALIECQDIWRERRVLLHYTAPRLRRDRLRNVAGKDNLSATPWMQPMMEALGIGERLKQDVAGHAVSLMPESGTQGRRYLLNFPVSLEPEPLIAALGKQSLWKNQFNGTRDKSIHLHWPSTMDEKYQENAWWNRKESFVCLAADLGTRACASVALMRFSPGHPQQNERLIGVAAGQPWKSSRIDAKLLRLPGEDMRVFENGEMRDEPFGSKGRLPDSRETAEYRDWLETFQIPEDHFWRERAASLSFPQQNDWMLRIFRRGQVRNMQLNRWLRFISESDAPRQKDALAEIAEEPMEQWKQWAGKSDLGPLQAALRVEIDKHQDLLRKHVVVLANRVIPLRGRRWDWVQREDRVNWILVQKEAALDESKNKIRGQRGISTMRIEQIEELRRRLQSLNRALQRKPGEKAKMGRSSANMEIPDPCPEIADKLESLKEQRTNQTAHLILAEALGVRLKAHSLDLADRKARDVHGEYEAIPGRNPVDFIVLEDLSRYRTSQDRGPSENSRLMQWCHRAVTDKLKQLCEPYGIPVLETPAAYTSKFCSRTGVAGFRAREIKPGEEFRLGKKQKESKEFERLQQQLKQLQDNGLEEHSLIVPARGGPRFVAMVESRENFPSERVSDADINAACNLALRAVAAPDSHDLLPRLRCVKEEGQLRFIGTIPNSKPSKRDAKKFSERIDFSISGESLSEASTQEDEEESAGRVTNVFVDVGNIANFEKVRAENWSMPLATGKGLWGTIKKMEFSYCLKLNQQRLKKWIKSSNGPQVLDPNDRIPGL